MTNLIHNISFSVTKTIFCLFIVFTLLHTSYASNCNHYTKSNTLVNDYSNILSQKDKNKLEQRLKLFNDSTSNQIVVLITPTLYGEDIMTFGQNIAQEWGIGQKEYNNGVLILIKSKTSQEPDGEVAILTGYGLEGALPDIFCKRIIDDKMTSDLANGDYYEAIENALDIILPVAQGEYNFAQYKKDELREAFIGIGVSLILVLVIVIPLARYAKKHPTTISNSGPNVGPFVGGSIGSANSAHSNGFGGFGGGGFGGGGAHGKF